MASREPCRFARAAAFPAAAVLLAVSLSHAADDPFAKSRARMVEQDIRKRGIADSRVVEAMGRVPRHEFVLPSDRFRAYGDHPLPIGEGQTISQPFVVAYMTQAARIEPGERVLEVGTGSGYQAAVLAEMTDQSQVYSMEIREGLARGAAEKLKALGYSRVGVRHGNGYHGWPEHAPYDAILVTAAANHIPSPLIKQLKSGGRLVIPVGSTTYHQTLTLVTKGSDGKVRVDHLLDVRFVPLIGAPQR